MRRTTFHFFGEQALLRGALLLVVCWGAVGWHARARADETAPTMYGPVLTWHTDPARTITVTWVEPDEAVATARAAVGWQAGQAGFGYGDGDDRTELADMKGHYSRIYLRHRFVLDGPPGPAPAVLHIRYDDAFIAYLNGQEVARRGVGRGAGPRARDIDGHEAGSNYEAIALDDWPRLARPGENVLAIEGHNASMSSSDLTLDPYLTADPAGQTALIERNGRWDYLAGADPAAAWIRPDFTPPAPPPADASASPAPAATSKAAPVVWIRAVEGDDWRKVVGATRPFADTGHRVQSAFITDLEPQTEYAVALGENRPTGLEGTMRFRTAPIMLVEPLRFVTGGDMEIGETARAMNRQAGLADPLFALLGGDLAYANARSVEKWFVWLDNWADYALTPDGRSVPMVIAIGNHETGSNLSVAEAERLGTHPRAKLFYSLFTLPEGKSYYALDFGDYLSLIVLDSDHTVRVNEQTPWLAEALAERADRPFTFACYHRPAYGTAKSPHLGIREQWVPLFEQYRLDAVFENDHHTFKRTHPLRQGRVDLKDGIVYLGDGAWGVGPRKVPDLRRLAEEPDLRIDPATKQEIWHLARAESRNHLWCVTLTPDGARYEAWDRDGQVFDRWPSD